MTDIPAPRAFPAGPLARRAASALLLAAVGLMAGGCAGGLATSYVYFIGLWLGAPVGAVLGGWLGWSAAVPLRDSVALFVSSYGGWIAGAALAARLRAPAAQGGGGMVAALWDLALPVAGALAGVVLVYLPVRRFVSFPRRRAVAAALTVVAAAYLLGRLYHYAFVWQPS